jgi:hypothetical protein
MCRGFSGLESGVIGTFDGNSPQAMPELPPQPTALPPVVGFLQGFFIDRIFFGGLILAFTDDCLLVGDV